MATHENRTSFEPFKNENRTSTSSLVVPSSLTKTSSVTTSKSGIMSVLESEKHSEDTKKHTKEFADAFPSTSRYARPHSPSGKFPIPPTPSHIPPTPSHMSHDHHRDSCTHCKTTGRHDSFSSLRPHVPPPLCQCTMCLRMQDQKCVYPPPAAMHYHPSYKYMPPALSSCRDPNCSNCSAKVSNKNVQNFLHPALVQQCTHGSLNKPPYTAPPSKPPYTTPPSTPTQNGSQEQNTKAKPYVCNWMSNGKHCGLSYTHADELFQHLRTHTSLQQQQQNEIDNRALAATTVSHNVTPTAHALPHNGSAQNGCRIHGCPCNISPKRSSPRTSLPTYSYGSFESSSFRYSPYARHLPHIGGPSTYTGHSYVPHGFHY